MRVIPAASYVALPWKNGGGVTHEIARSDRVAIPGWRLSVATIDRDGPFSDFSGCDRTIVPLEGAGFTLAFDGGERVRLERAYEPFAFAGEARVACSLIGGRSRDFNAITRRDVWVHAVRRVDVPRGGIAMQLDGVGFVYACGPVSIRCGNDEAELAAGDTVELPHAASAAITPLRGDATVLAITLRRS